MNLGFPLAPEQASTMAARVDSLFYFWLGVSIFFAVLIWIFIIAYVIKYRRRSEDERPPRLRGDLRLEVFWTVVPFGLMLIMFFWGAKLYFITYQPPADSLEINVVSKQWMWKVRHPDGQQEIDQLHIPVGRAVKLLLTSQDVIHSFFVPAFRIKTDVLPGRYTTMWFQATKPGEYHLFCAEYCGTQHSGMVGRVVAMAPSDYQAWLSSRESGLTLGEAGERLFGRFGCVNCHGETNSARGPSLVGLFGRTVKLQDGSTVVADENYVRESIVLPQAKIVAGYQPIMPTFKGLIGEDAIVEIVSYLKSLSQGEGSQAKR